MHELPVTQSILDIAVRNAREANARRITEIFLVIGELSSLVDDSIQFYWDLIAKDSIAEGATLHFKRIPAELQCLACQELFPHNRENVICPKCGGTNVKVTAGDEFFMEAIEVDNAEQGDTV